MLDLAFTLCWTENSPEESVEDFPSGPVVRTLPFNAGDADLISGWEAKIPICLWQKKKKNQNTKEKQCYNKFNKDFLNGPL